MAQERRYDIALHLDNLGQLFTVPEPDPFDSRARFAAGLETIITELKPQGLTRKLRTTGGRFHGGSAFTRASCTWTSFSKEETCKPSIARG
jgi:hypothetical protein